MKPAPLALGLVAVTICAAAGWAFVPPALLDRAIEEDDRALATAAPRAAGDAEVLAVALTADGSRLAVGGTGPHVLIHDATSGEHVLSLELQDWAVDLDWSGDGRWLAAVARGGRVLIWDVRAGQPVWASPSGSVGSAIAFHPTAATAAWADRDGSIQLVHVSEQRTGGRLVGLDGPATSLAWTPGGGSLLAGTRGGSVASFAKADGRLELQAAAHEGPVTGLSSPEGRPIVITAGHDGAVRVWSLDAELTLLNERSPHSGRWLAAATLGPHERFVAGGTSRDLFAWSFAGERDRLSGQGSWIRSLAVSADGTRVATGGGGQVVLWRGPDLVIEQVLTPAHRLVDG